MNLMSFIPRPAAKASLAAVLAVALLGVGCGGGVGTGGTGSPLSTYAQGPVQGFGSVIVNGLRFDDATASVEDGEGAPRNRDTLRLGMTVEVEAGPVSTGADGPSAIARRIRVDSELQGLVGSVDASGGSFTLLGQRVLVENTTVFDEALEDGPAGLRPGQAVEVHAQFDPAAGRYRATRVEVLTPARLALSGLRLRGPVAEVDRAARRLRIGEVWYGYDGATGVPADLTASQTVRLRLALADLGGLGAGAPLRWEVRAFQPALRALGDAAVLRLRGLVTAVGAGGALSVEGRPVDSGAAVLSGGPLAVGLRVEVQGRIVGGVLQADRIEVRTDAQEQAQGFELRGPVTAFSPALGLLVLRGQTVGTARVDLVFEGGTRADLVPGRRIEVRGMLSADRRRVDATRIRFE